MNNPAFCAITRTCLLPVLTDGKINCKCTPVATLRRSAQNYEADFDRAVDGDTLILWIRESEDVKVRRRCRLRGIESHEPEGATLTAAAAVAAKINALLKGERLIVEMIPNNNDRYGRALITATWRGADVGALIVKNGWGWQFTKADAQAHAAKNVATFSRSLAKFAAVWTIFLALALACHAPMVNSGGATFVNEAPQPAPRPLPVVVTTAPTLTNYHQGLPEVAPTARVIIAHGGQYTTTGNDSPVTTTATDSQLVGHASWKGYAVAAACGALTLLLVIVGAHIGWRVVINAIKAAVV